jgi:hypothetical protein
MSFLCCSTDKVHTGSQIRILDPGPDFWQQLTVHYTVIGILYTVLRQHYSTAHELLTSHSLFSKGLMIQFSIEYYWYSSFVTMFITVRHILCGSEVSFPVDGTAVEEGLRRGEGCVMVSWGYNAFNRKIPVRSMIFNTPLAKHPITAIWCSSRNTDPYRSSTIR